MPKYLFTGAISLLLSVHVFSQNSKLSAFTLSSELTQNANAVVRQNDLEIEIQAYDKMVVKEHRIVTVLNEKGNSDIHAMVWYDDTRDIKVLEARIYNSLGSELRKLNKKDFKDVAAVDGVSLFQDNRIKYLDYTAVGYPYTVDFVVEYVETSTAFIPGWNPLDDYYVSIEKASYKIINNTDVEILEKVSNFEGFNIEKKYNFHYQAKDLSAVRYEAYSPTLSSIVPNVKVALNEFKMKGVKGVNNNWGSFGKWMYEELLSGTRELPQETINEVRGLVKDAKTDIEKARLVYEYMQNRTRYISVQVGIGGWKPMLAEDVDRLGYGDCKGLTNYTKALLDAVGVKSFYTIVHGGREPKNIDRDFSSTQGNHAFLCIPHENDYVWLECTSQTDPFGFIAKFTDDRDVLVVTPDEGRIERTKAYKEEENFQDMQAVVNLNGDGSASAKVNISSGGSQYYDHHKIQFKDSKDQTLYYKDFWGDINKLELTSIHLQNDKSKAVFYEEVTLKTGNLVSKAGTRVLLAPNFFNKITSAPPRYENRKLPFEMDRGFVDTDRIEVVLPQDLVVEALQDDVTIKNKFGEYRYTITQISDNKLLFERFFKMNKGNYEKGDYKAFREFWLQVVKQDKSKIVLIQKV
ncbi:DUF3857 domain-containing protein [Mangrovimonas aestuarii]|uniref:DUF3857 domain-containing protein n=1 Tax=Mangrovimonas aestuarii TaxID=3018443 RepID=UPI0023784EFB|nr:DUF3857 domain-containing protein [Mangrovimonas aestuarii]